MILLYIKTNFLTFRFLKALLNEAQIILVRGQVIKYQVFIKKDDILIDILT